MLYPIKNYQLNLELPDSIFYPLMLSLMLKLSLTKKNFWRKWSKLFAKYAASHSVKNSLKKVNLFNKLPYGLLKLFRWV